MGCKLWKQLGCRLSNHMFHPNICFFTVEKKETSATAVVLKRPSDLPFPAKKSDPECVWAEKVNNNDNAHFGEIYPSVSSSDKCNCSGHGYWESIPQPPEGASNLQVVSLSMDPCWICLKIERWECIDIKTHCTTICCHFAEILFGVPPFMLCSIKPILTISYTCIYPQFFT